MEDIKNVYMFTRTGIHYPFSPRLQDINITDIAHHLSNKCRFAGATKEFYSVAEHSVYVSQLLPDKLKMEGLLHDASEAYNGDLIRPLKYSAEFARPFNAVEEINEKAIALKFGLIYPWPYAVKEADDIVGLEESYRLIEHNPSPNRIYEKKIPENFKFKCLLPKEAFEFFMTHFEEYSKNVR